MAEKTILIEDTLQTLVNAKKFSTLRDILATMNPADVAAVFEEIDPQSLPLLFRLLPKELASDAFVEMDSDFQELLIRGFSDTELKEVVDELYLDDAVDLVEEMPSNVVKRILRQADPDTRRMINEVLKYPEDSAGSLMTNEFVSLRPQMTVDEAEKRIRRTGVDKETINTCYVTDKGELIGAVSIRTLLLSEGDELIENIMETNVISVTTTDDQEDVAQMFSKYNFNALPVVDKENRLVGIVTVDDAIDVMEEEATEDIAHMAGMSASDHPYFHTSVFETWKDRIPWLLGLMLSYTLAGLVIFQFRHQLELSIIFSCFIPLLAGTAGNSATQASTAVTRGLALDEIAFSDIMPVIWKELRVAFLCGICLAAANFAKMYLVDMLWLGAVSDFYTIGVVCLALFCVVIISKLVGCVLPIVSEKIGLDPALVAGPVMAALIDVLSLAVYFSIVTAMVLQ